MSKPLIFICLVSLAFLVGCSAGVDVTLYLNNAVAIDGDGSSAANAWKNLDTALADINSKLTSATTSYNITLLISPGAIYSFTTGLAVTATLPQRLIMRSTTTSYVIFSTTGTCFSFGGAMEEVQFSYVTLTGCTGGQPVIGVSGIDRIVLDHVTIKTNDVSGGGSPLVSIVNTDSSSITDLDFKGNVASATPQGMFYLNRNTAPTGTVSHMIQNSQFTSNTLNSALVFLADSVTFDNCDFAGNSGPYSLMDIQASTGSGSLVINLKNTRITQNTVGSIIHCGSLTVSNNVYIDQNSQIYGNTNAGGIFETQCSGNEDTVHVDVNALVGQNSNDQFSCNPSGTIIDNAASPHNLCNIACTGDSKFDRCYVCGGNSACVGCDNVPYSGVVCPKGSSEDDNNTDPLDSVAEWDDGAPNPTLRPLAGSNQYVQITSGKIEERKPSGEVVRSLDMSTLPWQVTEPPQPDTSKYVRRYLYYASLPPYTKVQIEQKLYRATEEVTSGGVTFTVERNSLKFSIDIANWGFSDSTNYLAFDLTFTLSEGLQSETTTSTTVSGFDITTLKVFTATTVATVNLQEFAVIDGVTKSIQISQPSSTTTTRVFEFRMPAGNFSECSYDPDFSVIATPSDSGDGGSDNTGLIVGLTVGLSVFALLVVVVIIVGAVLFGWLKIHRHNRVSKLRSSSMVNFHNEEEEGGGSDSSE